jgi:predicted Zn-ribbon and HTH transcriptional regulator
MPRPPIEVADIIRAAGESFFEGSQKWFTWLHLKVLNAILCCRTAALGGHVDACSGCGYQAVSFNSCRNRHCPKCQANARDRWLEVGGKELLPTRYVHVVFTLPRQLSPPALQNKREVYALLFQVARHPKRLGAEIGFFSVLHTSTVWFPPAVWLRTTPDGSTRSKASFCPSMFSGKCFGASSWMA